MEPELTPTHLGELLRDARERRGLTLDRVERDTRIRRRYLEAMEADRLEEMPEPVFARGLVRAYASYLGLSTTEALELLGKEEQRQDVLGLAPVVDPARVPRVRGQWVTRSVGMLALGCLVGLALYFWLPYARAFVQGASAATATPPSPTAVAATPAAAPAVQPTATTAPRPSPLPSATATPGVLPTSTPLPTPTFGAEQMATATAAANVRGVTVEARANGRVWAQIEADNVVVFSGFLMPAEKRTWRAERRISMYAGDAGRLDVTVNGRTLGLLGPLGEVVKEEWVSAR